MARRGHERLLKPVGSDHLSQSDGTKRVGGFEYVVVKRCGSAPAHTERQGRLLSRLTKTYWLPLLPL